MIDKTRFFNGYRESFGKLRASQVTGIDTLLDSFNNDTTEYSIPHVAYMLATVKHECADTWKPIVEYGPDSYFAKYEFNTNLGRDLGNIHPGDGLLYKGRGYAMITGRSNYFRFTKKLGLLGTSDLINFPDRACNPTIAYQILTLGCSEGLFTGICVGKYINNKSIDYVNARRVVNGLDKAKKIANFASIFENILAKSTV